MLSFCAQLSSRPRCCDLLFSVLRVERLPRAVFSQQPRGFAAASEHVSPQKQHPLAKQAPVSCEAADQPGAVGLQEGEPEATPSTLGCPLHQPVLAATSGLVPRWWMKRAIIPPLCPPLETSSF